MLFHLSRPQRFAALMLACATSVIADVPVDVYLKTPTEVAEQEQLESVLRVLPGQMEKWRAASNRSVSYVVKQGMVDLLVPDPCESLPIRVTIVRGRLKSATYEESGGHCKRGAPASHKSPRGQDRYLTPDDLFRRIAKAEEELRCYKTSAAATCLATALRVTYDEKSGLPLKIEDYSDAVSDYYWSLDVTEMQMVP